MNPTHPVLERLAEQTGRCVGSAAELDALLAEPGDLALFCGGNPVQHPECLDVAVVLPELLKAYPDRLKAAVAAPALEADLQARYGFSRWPTLVFLRDGGYVGAISGMQDWPVFVARCAELLAAAIGRPPTVGIAVTAAASSTCH